MQIWQGKVTSKNIFELERASSSEEDAPAYVNRSTDHSNLISKLLLSACSGDISFASAQSSAYAAYLDGLHHEEVVQMARCGNWGMQEGNIKRDVERLFFKDIPFASPIDIPTIGLNNKTNEVNEISMSVFLPHEIVASSMKYGGSDCIWKTDLLTDFWARVKPDDARLQTLFAETDIDLQMAHRFF